jgi:ATP-dependent helicase/nuclease subunit B
MGAIAERERRAPGIGRFDGWLGRRVPGLRPGPGDVVSVSRLEDLTACPYRYFLKHVLRVRPPDVPEDVPGGWLSALEFGSLLHTILRAFMEIVSDWGERVDAAAHAVLLAEVTARHVEAQRERTPVLHEPGFRVDVMRLERALRIFLKEESRRTAVPVGFEVSFGMGRSGGLSREEPVRLKLSERFELLLRGSIDRVDRTDEGFEVWDYKSGSTFDYDEFDLLMRGRRLQWALYAHVLDELLEGKGEVARTMRSGYFFTSDREHGLRLSQVPPDRSEVARVLEPVFAMLDEGVFPHIQKSDACRYCDYNGICASERRDRNDMDEIRAATDHGFMDALNRWMEI